MTLTALISYPFPFLLVTNGSYPFHWSSLLPIKDFLLVYQYLLVPFHIHSTNFLFLLFPCSPSPPSISPFQLSTSTHQQPFLPFLHRLPVEVLSDHLVELEIERPVEIPEGFNSRRGDTRMRPALGGTEAMGLPASLALHQTREAFGGIEEEVFVGDHSAKTQKLLQKEEVWGGS